MQQQISISRAGLLAVSVVVALVTAACGGDGNSSPTSPSPTPPPAPDTTPTVTITSSGVNPREIRIQVGQSVRFVNNDTRAREIASNPHPTHSDCPAINQLGVLNPGQNRTTGAFQQARVCGYHDHLTDDTDERFRGRILVGDVEPGEDDDTY